MPMDAYILIGNANTRKTSVVRSLTGCFNRSVRDIQLQGSRRPQRFYARVGTLQITRTSIEDFIQEVSRSRCEAVVFCLSPTAHKTDLETFPDALTYVADTDNWGQADYWATPREMLERGGDCEDFALLKRKKLQEVIGIIRDYNPNAFYSIEDVRSVSGTEIPEEEVERKMSFRKFFPVNIWLILSTLTMIC